MKRDRKLREVGVEEGEWQERSGLEPGGDKLLVVRRRWKVETLT